MRREWIVDECWLWCGQATALVLWLGPVKSLGQWAPLYACEPCLSRLDDKASAHLVSRSRRTAGFQRRWITGECWLWCERIRVPVLWLGDVEREDVSAPLHACEGCIRWLEAKLHTHVRRRAISA